MSIAPIPAVAPAVAPPATRPAAGAPGAPGFAEAVSGALDAVSAAEAQADAAVQDVAAGGETGVHDLMVAMTKASLSVELLAQARNRAVEAYQEIMRMQV